MQAHVCTASRERTRAVPEISVLIPIYNVERYLEACLDSLRSQSFTDFEALCINDGSTDGSKAVIDRFVSEDSRFRLIDKANSGYGASMNRGLDEAQGAYVAILESDDRMLPGALQRLHDAVASEHAQVAKGNFNLYWSTPSERRELFCVVPDEAVGRTFDCKQQPQIFYRKPSIWSALYDRAFLKHNEVRFLETPGASYQDASFSFKAFAAADRVTFIDDAIIDYRQDNEASSVNAPGKVFCVCDEYAEMERYLAARPCMRNPLEAVKNKMKFYSYMWNYERLSDDLKPVFLERASAELADDLAVGGFDLNDFEVSERADLLAMAKQPQLFAESRAYAAPGKLNTFRRYFKLGGLSMVLEVLASKRKGA